MQHAEVFTKKNSQEYLNDNCNNSLTGRLLMEGFGPHVSNFKTEQIVITFGERSMIGTVNDKEYDNSPICSPINLFCHYPKQRLQMLKTAWLRHFLSICTSSFSLAFKKAKFNRVVQVNNKPSDAITYPKLTDEQFENCLQNLLFHFPDHGIIFPRIDKVSSPELYQNLINYGFWMVPTRTAHIYSPEGDHLKRSHTKRDFSFLKKQKYTFAGHEQIFESDLGRIHELYQMLFIEKHSRENPNLTLKFFKESHANGWYKFFGVRNEQGVIDGFLAYEIQDGVMACGPLGYDTSMAQEKGLYRMIFAHSLRIAKENNLIYNFGGGNEKFKLNRGSIREIGYTAIYCKHLPLYRQLPWWILGKFGHKLTVKILKSVLF